MPQDALRLMAPVLLLWLVGLLLRTPHQARTNRLLAAFLAILAAGFLAEYAWILLQDEAPGAAKAANQVARAAGNVDPPLLLAYALSFGGPLGTRGHLAWAVSAAVGLFDFYAGLEWLHLGFVNGTYIAAFVALLARRARERSPVVHRELEFLAVGVGFAALSRSAAIFGIGPSALFIQLGPALVAAGLGASLLLLGVVAVGHRVFAPRDAPSAHRLFVALAALLAGFHIAWGAIVAVETGLGDLAPVAGAWWSYRWILFAGIVGYGILRYQIFDLHVRVRHALELLLSVPTGFVLAVAVAAGAGGAGASPAAAQGAGLLAGLIAAGALHPVARRVVARVFPDLPALAFEIRRLEIYEATLRHGVGRAAWSPEGRRLVETLQAVLEITPEEHARIEARARQGPPRS